MSIKRVIIVPDAQDAIDKYIQVRLDMETRGEMTQAQWMHARSYAAEFCSMLLRDNPQLFPEYHAGMEKIRRAKKGRHG